MVVSPARQRPKKAPPEHREIQTDPWMPFPPHLGPTLGGGGKGGEQGEHHGENGENMWGKDKKGRKSMAKMEK